MQKIFGIFQSTFAVLVAKTEYLHLGQFQRDSHYIFVIVLH